MLASMLCVFPARLRACVRACILGRFSIVHALSSFNLYEDAIHEPLEEFDDLSDAISDPTTQ